MERRGGIWPEVEMRPLVLGALGLIFGILALKSLWFFLPVLLVALVAKGLKAKSVLVVFCVLGVLLAKPEQPPLVQRQWVNRTVVVATVPRLYPEASICEVSIAGTRLLMRYDTGLGLGLGDRLKVSGVAVPFREGTEGSYLAEGVIGRLLPYNVEVVHKGPWIYGVGSRWRDSFVQFSEETLSPRAAAAIEAICFNVDTALDPEDRDAMRRSGLIHVVSASGFHVGVLAAALALVLSLLPIPRVAQLGIVLLVLLLYAAATGMRPPVIRSGLMAMVVLSAYSFKREPDYLSALALAAVVQLLWQPWALYDPGFQLSFSVVGALILFGPMPDWTSSSAGLRVWGVARHGLMQSLVAILASMPIVGLTFRTVSLSALPANALAALALPVITVGAMLAHLLWLLVPAVGVGLAKVVVEPLVGWLYLVIDFLGGPWAGPEVPIVGWWWVALGYGLVLSVWRAKLRPAE
jgi:ComEC/Rec2-related protein